MKRFITPARSMAAAAERIVPCFLGQNHINEGSEFPNLPLNHFLPIRMLNPSNAPTINARLI